MAEDGEKKGSTFNVEYDKSGRAACKEKDCKMKITKGSVRIGKAFEAFERLQHHVSRPRPIALPAAVAAAAATEGSSRT
jgi:hypothetical protein